MRSKVTRWYRRPRTTQERRANQDGKYVRAKRRPANIPNSWDDFPVCSTNSWKDKRKKQYRDKPRGQKHEIYIDVDIRWTYLFEVQEYFKQHDIPHVIEPVRVQCKSSYCIKTKTVKIRNVPYYITKWEKGQPVKKHQSGYKDITYTEELPPELWKIMTYKYSKTVGYIIRWWSDKDIGIDFIYRALG